MSLKTYMYREIERNRVQERKGKGLNGPNCNFFCLCGVLAVGEPASCVDILCILYGLQ